MFGFIEECVHLFPNEKSLAINNTPITIATQCCEFKSAMRYFFMMSINRNEY